MEAGRLIAVLATFAVGAIVALQPPVNSELGKQTTVLVAAFVGTAHRRRRARPARRLRRRGSAPSARRAASTRSTSPAA